MSARVDRARRRLARSRDEILARLAAQPPERLTRRPASGQWCALEILEHTQLVERGVVRMLQAPPPGSPVPLRSAFVARTLRRLPPRVRLWLLAHRLGKAEAPSGVRPRATPSQDAVTSAAAEARDATQRFLAESRPAWLASVRRTHPVLGELDGCEWIEFLAAHEERHLRQLREALR